LIGRHHIYAVAREKLVPKPPETHRRDPRKAFSDTATKIFSVPKSEIDKREADWKKRHGAKAHVMRPSRTSE
jgi:hypothetical protein